MMIFNAQTARHCARKIFRRLLNQPSVTICPDSDRDWTIKLSSGETLVDLIKLHEILDRAKGDARKGIEANFLDLKSKSQKDGSTLLYRPDGTIAEVVGNWIHVKGADAFNDPKIRGLSFKLGFEI